MQWPLKKIIWLLVQIWFGNTSLSFSQAESFHKVFGPILMTTFAALSNTLLLTSAKHLDMPIRDQLIGLLSAYFNLIEHFCTH